MKQCSVYTDKTLCSRQTGHIQIQIKQGSIQQHFAYPMFLKHDNTQGRVEASDPRK